jgi:hypothetical protein
MEDRDMGILGMGPTTESDGGIASFASFDSDLPMGVLKQRLANYDGLMRENGMLLSELRESKGKVNKMEKRMLAEISNAKRTHR